MRILWSRKRNRTYRTCKFFLIALSHETLVNHYQTNFSMMQHHGYSLTELDSMMPWERAIYTALLIQHLKEEKERLEKSKK